MNFRGEVGTKTDQELFPSFVIVNRYTLVPSTAETRLIFSELDRHGSGSVIFQSFGNHHCPSRSTMGRRINANGKEAWAVRNAAALPLTWGLIDNDRLADILANIVRRIDDPTIETPDLDAIVRLLMILQTGRDHESLDGVRIVQVPSLSLTAMQHQGICIAPEGSLLFIENPHSKANPDTPFIILPPLPILDRAARNMSTGVHADISIRFNLEAEERVRGLIRELSEGLKAEKGTAALQRWLLHRMRAVDGGDPAIAAILNPSERDVRKTLSAYFACDGERYWDRYTTALKPLAKFLPSPPDGVASLRYGTRYCPRTGDVRRMIAPLRRMLARQAIDPGLRSGENSASANRFGTVPMLRDWHVAMTLHTFALVSFGTGQRCQQPMADTAAIDPESGFAWVVEKGNPNHGTDGARGVYHCRMVRQQIAAYEKYCRDLADRFDREGDIKAASAIRVLLAEEGLRFFDYTKEGIQEIGYPQLRKLSPSFPWPFVTNAGRKWLRSALSGTVPSDAIAAQFGHHHDGFSVWASPSALRPDEVRRVLETAIDTALSDAGFSCSLANPPPLPRIFSDAPERISSSTSRRDWSGQFAAMAMWHGALLNEDRLRAVIARARGLSAYGEMPDWLDLDRETHASQDRWFIDPQTRALLDERRHERRALSEDVDKILSRFLGPARSATAFKHAAERRWRFKLPPVLFELAIGRNADNHSLTSEIFDPNTPRRQRSPRVRQVRIDRRMRETGDSFLKYLDRCWPERGLPTDRKKRAHARTETLSREPFYQHMSPFERSLAKAVVTGFAAKRRYNDPVGDMLSDIRARAERLWQDVVPVTHRPWEQRPLADFNDKMLRQRLPSLAPWRGRAARELAILLVDNDLRSRDDPIIEELHDLDRNHTANLLRAAEYPLALSQANPPAGDAITLSYRAGFRFGELDWIGRAQWVEHHGVETILLDHTPYARLKTFDSRRRIPIGLLLPKGELDRIRRLAADSNACQRLRALRSDDRALIKPLDEATNSRFGFHPLRHTFATNAYAAMLWPNRTDTGLERFFDLHLLDRRQKLRRHLCGEGALGAASLHAVAMMMGHTHPWRTLFSYVHHLEVMLAAWVRSITPPPAPLEGVLRK